MHAQLLTVLVAGALAVTLGAPAFADGARGSDDPTGHRAMRDPATIGVTATKAAVVRRSRTTTVAATTMTAMTVRLPVWPPHLRLFRVTTTTTLPTGGYYGYPSTTGTLIPGTVSATTPTTTTVPSTTGTADGATTGSRLLPRLRAVRHPGPLPRTRLTRLPTIGGDTSMTPVPDQNATTPVRRSPGTAAEAAPAPVSRRPMLRTADSRSGPPTPAARPPTPEPAPAPERPARSDARRRADPRLGGPSERPGRPGRAAAAGGTTH